MKKLPSYAKHRLLHGAAMTGTFTEGYYHAEEHLYLRDSAILYKFCQWIDAHIGGAAPGNIDMLYTAYSNPSNTEAVEAATALAARIRYIKSL